MNCDKFTNVFFNGQERGIMLTYINTSLIAIMGDFYCEGAVTGVTAQATLRAEVFIAGDFFKGDLSILLEMLSIFVACFERRGNPFGASDERSNQETTASR